MPYELLKCDFRHVDVTLLRDLRLPIWGNFNGTGTLGRRKSDKKTEKPK